MNTEVYKKVCRRESVKIEAVNNSLTSKLRQIITFPREIYHNSPKAIKIIMKGGLQDFLLQYREYSNRKKLLIDSNSVKKVYTQYFEDFVQRVNNKKPAFIEIPVFSQKPEILIVISSTNAFQNLDYCVLSVMETSPLPYQIVLFIPELTKAEVEKFKLYKNTRLLLTKEGETIFDQIKSTLTTSNARFIVFLDSDTIVGPGWIVPLIELFKCREVGGVCSKSIFPNGRISNNDDHIDRNFFFASPEQRNDMEHPAYNYVKTVNFCSKTALLVDAGLIMSISEGSARLDYKTFQQDLSAAINEMGELILYQPDSVVIHVPDNMRSLEVLQGNPQKKSVPDTPRQIFLADKNNRKQILVIDQFVPLTDRDAGSSRMFHILKILKDIGYEVDFIGTWPARFEPYTTYLQQNGIVAWYGPYVDSVTHFLQNSGNEFDLVIVSRIQVYEGIIKDVKKYCLNARIIYDTVDLTFLRESRRAELTHNSRLRKRADDYKRLEISLMKQSDMSWVVSPIEKQILLSIDSSLAIEIVPTIDTIQENIPKFSERKNILFIGGFSHPPNADAVIYFIEAILPFVMKKIPDIKFYIIGNSPPAEVQALASDNIIITGFVEDVSSYFRSVKISVVPLRFGAGVKGKINQSLSFGVPVVTTSVGAEGMGLVDGVNAFVEDLPEEFAKKIIDLYTNEELWNTLSRNSLKVIENQFSYDLWKKKIGDIVNSILLSP